MKNKYSKLFTIGMFMIMMYSCSIPEIAQKDVDVNIPESYKNNVKDTVNTANVNWKDFFEDSYLTELIDSAVVNNKEINILLQRINIAQNEIQARKGEYLPFVSAGAGADIEKVGRYTRNGAVEENLDIKDGKSFPDPLANLQFGLYASWELDIWKKLRNAKKVAYFEYLASKEGKNFATTNLVSEITNSYYELIALDNQLKILNQSIDIQKNALEIVKDLMQASRVNLLAVKRFEAEVLKNQSKVFEINQSIVETENEINFLMGRAPQPIMRTNNDFTKIQPKVIKNGIPSQLLENRPDIRMAELELAASNLNIKVAKANFYPSFSIKAGLGYQAFDPKYLLTTPESLLYSLGGDITAPLINRSAIKAQYKNASAKQIEATYDYEKTILNAYREVANQLSNMENLEKNIQTKNEQVKVLNQSIEIASQLFISARADYMEVLLTQRDALEAKMELIENKESQMNAMVNLYKALGGGWK